MITRNIILIALTLAFNSAHARTFTDSEGRTVEADLSGLRGENIVMSANGMRAQWPIAKLSQADQSYVRAWQKEHSGVNRIGVRAFQKEGVGEKGAFAATESTPAPSLPIGPKVEVKPIYKHYQVELNNAASVDAANLQADYVLYVITPDGSVRANAGRQDVATIPAGKSNMLTTEGATAAKTKATSLKIAINNNNISTTEKTDRSQDQFGGIWVKVYSVEGKVIGEQKQLTPALEKMNPAWEEVAAKEEIPLLSSFEAFKELIKKVLPPGPGARPGPPLPP